MNLNRDKIGAAPGTLFIPEGSQKSTIEVTSYNRQSLEVQKVENVADLATALKDDCINWVNICGFGDEESVKAIGDIFNIHRLALEDILNVNHRPKVESYDNHLFMIVKMITAKADAKVDIEQVSIFLGRNYVLTIQQRPGDVLDPIRERLSRGGHRPIRQMGSDYLAYAIIDAINDAFFPVLESISEWLEPIDYKVIHDPTPELLGELNRLKKQLVSLRRATWPQREVISSLLRDDYELINEEVRIFLRDTYDHSMQITELNELYREMISELLNTYMTSLANRTNEVMKVLTIVATVFIPLTFFAGIYGMNFEHMPELSFRWSYPILWFVMVFSASGMFYFFWRRGWIGSKRPPG